MECARLQGEVRRLLAHVIRYRIYAIDCPGLGGSLATISLLRYAGFDYQEERSD